ncbi:hypothetical protein KSP40_PGU008009 [Platanthera guangdongensis]|uniref:Uncharacterized protein n=1 Tax=Platanthera guangdongensis TaxID=2320717 RepID=A0ABR2MA71_9ASPA
MLGREEEHPPIPSRGRVSGETGNRPFSRNTGLKEEEDAEIPCTFPEYATHSKLIFHTSILFIIEEEKMMVERKEEQLPAANNAPGGGDKESLDGHQCVYDHSRWRRKPSGRHMQKRGLGDWGGNYNVIIKE